MTARQKMPDDTSWPIPDPNLEWRLRYGTPTRNDLLACASILSAYQTITTEAPRTQRDMVCRELRAVTP